MSDQKHTKTLTIDKTQAREHLEALGYQDGDTIFFRTFPPRNINDPPSPRKFSSAFPNIPQNQTANAGLYFVVNSGGDTDDAVVAGKALFCEWDDRPIDDQIDIWRDVNFLEPSIQVKTRKSVHDYWTIKDGCPIADWLELQLDLIEFMGADPRNKNPSRVMRIAGAWHIKADHEPLQCSIYSKSGRQYTYQELRDLIPHRPLDQKTRPKKTSTQDTDSKAPLSIFLTKKDRWLLTHGETQGNRHSSGFALAANIIGTASRLEIIEIEYSQDPYELFIAYCEACEKGADWDSHEWDEIWNSTTKANPTASLTDTQLENCYKKWQKEQDYENTSTRNYWETPVPWNGEIGYWKQKVQPKTDPQTGEVIIDEESQKVVTERVRVFVPLTNFNFEVYREFADEQGGGLVLEVKRSCDKEQKRITIRSLQLTKLSDFINALKSAYNNNVVCNLRIDQLNSIIHNKTVEYYDRRGKNYRLANRIGLQDDGTWVFQNAQLTPTGQITNEQETSILFNPELLLEQRANPIIAKPSNESLPNLVKAMHWFHGDSQIAPAILTLGWATACLHYQEIQDVEKYFPLLNLFGDKGTGKTLMAETALSLAGLLGKEGRFTKTTPSALYENLKLTGSLPLLWDDPEKSDWLDGLIQGLYNAEPRIVRGNCQQPHTSLMITSNHLIGEPNPATLSRIVPVSIFPSTDGDRNAWDELNEARINASGALPQLLELGYPKEKIRDIAKRLREHLPHAHVRVADSFAIVLWYAVAVCRIANFPEQRVVDYVVNDLCALANDVDSASNSLDDFLSNINALHAQSQIGEWDIRVVESTKYDGTFVALHMTSIWQKVERFFSPVYSRKVIESLIAKQGGILRATAQFHRSEDESKTYRRYQLAPRDEFSNLPSPPELVTRRCILIPAHLVTQFMSDSEDPPPGDGPPNAPPPPPSDNNGSGGSPTPKTPNPIVPETQNQTPDLQNEQTPPVDVVSSDTEITTPTNPYNTVSYILEEEKPKVKVDETALNLSYQKDFDIPAWEPTTTIKPYQELHIAALDIETTGLIDDEDARVIAVGIKTNRNEEVLISDQDEKQILVEIFTIICQATWDVLIGHNIFDFDLLFLHQRARAHNLTPPWQISSYETNITSASVHRNTIKFHQVWLKTKTQIIDTYHQAGIYDKQFATLSGYGLKDLAIVLGGRNERRLELSATEIRDCWDNGELEKIFTYLRFDLEDTLLLGDFFLPTIYHQIRVIPLPLQTIAVASPAKKWESVLKNYYSRPYPKPEEKMKYDGGYNQATPGLYKNAAKIDVSSMYPSIQLRYGICSKKDHEHFYLQVLQYLTTTRLELKKQLKTTDDPQKRLELNAIQNAFKILINGGYGFTGTEGYNFNCMSTAALVTAYGRVLIKKMMEIAETNGATIIEVDTDGIIFEHEDPKRIYQTVQSALPEGIKIDLDWQNHTIFVHKKKNYILVNEEHNVKIVGLYRKRDRSLLQQTFPVEYIKLWINDPTKATQYYQSVRNQIASGKYPVEKLQVTQKISNSAKKLLAIGNHRDIVTYYWGEKKLYGKRGKPIKSDKKPVQEGQYYVQHYLEQIDEIYAQLTTRIDKDTSKG